MERVREILIPAVIFASAVALQAFILAAIPA